MNVVDRYKGWEVKHIKEDANSKQFPYAVAMINFCYDMNIGTFIRNANAFGAEEIFYVQEKKKYDPRGAVGSYHYKKITHLKSIEDLMKLSWKNGFGYKFVCVENNVGRESIPLSEFKWPTDPLIIFGSEKEAIPDQLLDYSDYLVEIPMYGTVRSLNVGSCSAIVMNDCISKL